MSDTTELSELLANLNFYAREASCHPDPNYYLEFDKLCTPSNILAVLALLEAERQRANYAVKVKDNDEQTALYWAKIAAEALAEIAALKGDQVPLQQLFKEAIAWGRVYGPTMAKDLWFEMLDTQSCNFADRFTAPQKPIEHSDTRRMDWLCAHCVEVRDPQMYGSHAMFHAQQDSEEWDLPHHTTLREQVDAAIEAAGGIVKDGEL